jgi:hypothetical protein
MVLVWWGLQVGFVVVVKVAVDWEVVEEVVVDVVVVSEVLM